MRPTEDRMARAMCLVSAVSWGLLAIFSTVELLIVTGVIHA